MECHCKLVSLPDGGDPAVVFVENSLPGAVIQDMTGTVFFSSVLIGQSAVHGKK